jgi:hypothetical protein
MEEKLAPRARLRNKTAILQLLQEYGRSGQSVKDFCALQNIPQGTFHGWKHKYGKLDAIGDKAGFSPLQVMAEPGLFAEVGRIRIYQPVSAAYLKELAS